MKNFHEPNPTDEERQEALARFIFIILPGALIFGVIFLLAGRSW